MRVTIFASSAQRKEGEALAEAVGGRFVSTASSKAADLELMATYGVVEAVVVVGVRGSRVLVRLARMPEVEELRSLIARAG